MLKLWHSKIVISISILLVVLIGAHAGVKVYNFYNYKGELIGISPTNVYHRDDCIFVKKSSADKLKFFKDLKSSAEAGYRPCNTCNPPSNETYVAQLPVKSSRPWTASDFEDNNKYSEWVQQYKEDIKAGKLSPSAISKYDEERIRLGIYPISAYIHADDVPKWILAKELKKP